MSNIRTFIRKNPSFTVFLILTAALIAVAIFAPLLTGYSPYEGVLADSLQAPSAAHWFGTDRLGRDLFTRILYGARTSISSTLILVGIVVISGTFLGFLAGYFGGIADAAIMRIADMMLSFPGIIFAIAVAGILGATTKNAVLAIAVVTWPKYARLSRSLVLQLKEREFVAAARIAGTKPFAILWRYILPNSLPTLLVTGVTDIGVMMLEISSLSFLGFGAQSPTAEWGLMLSEGRAYLTSAPWLMIFPGLAIFVTVAIFNLLGDGLRDILDPGQK